MGKRLARRLWIAGVCLLAVVAALLLWRLNPAQGPLTAPAAGERLRTAAQGLDRIDIDATFDPVQSTLRVAQTLTLQNRSGTSLRQAVLRAYPNAFATEDTSPAATDELYDACYPDGFSAGGLSMGSLRAQGAVGEAYAPAYAYLDEAHTALAVTLIADWAAGETLTLQATYTVQIPRAAYRFGEAEGVWALGHVFLIPAPFEGGAYRTDAYSSIGEPFTSACANYAVRLTLPQGYAVAATGAQRGVETADGVQTLTFDAPAVRDFALCLSRDYRIAETLQNGVLVRALARAEVDARTLRDTAARALACYASRYGAYPYPVYTVCEATFPLGGTSYPMLGVIAADRLHAGGETPEQWIARTVARQWWGALVGSDGVNQPWQHEGLCGFSLLDYWETLYGLDARQSLQYAQADAAMRVTVPGGLTPGCPVDYYGDWTDYRTVAFGRGTAALCALDLALEGGLDGFLARYAETFAFAQATRTDFETLLAAATGQDWSPLLSDYLDTDLNN